MALREMLEQRRMMGAGPGMPRNVQQMAMMRGRPRPPGGPPQRPPGGPPPRPPMAAGPRGGPSAPPPPPMPMPSAPPPPPKPDPMQVMGGVALATLFSRGEKKSNPLADIASSGRDMQKRTGRDLSRVGAGMDTIEKAAASGGLLGLAHGGPVVRRRIGGLLDEEGLTDADRQKLLTELQNIVEGYHWDKRSFEPGQPIGLMNNPMIDVQRWALGTGGSGDYDVVIKRQADSPYGVGQYSMSSGVDRYNQIIELLGQDAPPSAPAFEELEEGVVAGSIDDPNLPDYTSAIQRLMYRDDVGFFGNPPGHTKFDETLLKQAYGDNEDIQAEIIETLKPRTPKFTAEEAYRRLPAQQILADRARKEARARSGGGLRELAAGGEFSGRVPGDGGGMQDNVRMPIKEGNKQVATLAVSPTEYVVDSHTMAALGNGNPDKGADYMDKVVEDIRTKAYGNNKQPKEIDGLATLKSMMD